MNTRSIASSLLCLMLPLATPDLRAQEATGTKATGTKATRSPTSTASKSTGMGLSGLFGGPLKEGPAGEAQALSRDFMLASMKWHRARLDEMRRNGNAPKSVSFGPVVPVINKFAPRFMKAAEKYTGTDDALPFLDWCLFTDRTPGNKTTLAALETVLAKNLECKGLAQSVLRFPQLRGVPGDRYHDALLTILEGSPHAEVRAAVYFARAESTKMAPGGDDAPEVVAAARAAAIADYQTALKLAPKATFADRARGALFGISSLQVGMKAPEIEGEDLDGDAFKLSDYTGKVIMLSFWGDW